VQTGDRRGVAEHQERREEVSERVGRVGVEGSRGAMRDKGRAGPAGSLD